MTLKQVQRFVAAVAALPEDRRRAFELAFHNPTDAAIVAFEAFGDECDRFLELVDIALACGVENAGRIADLVQEYIHRDDEPWCPEPADDMTGGNDEK